MDAIEHLQDAAWQTPRDYRGFSPVGDYLVLSRHRDSDLVAESNWAVACKELGAVDHDSGELDSRPPVYTFRPRHWAVGWVEYLLVRPDAPEATRKEAGEILCSLEDYPVLSDEDLSERERESASEHWASLSVRDRAEIIKRVGNCSIFAARRDYLPRDDNGAVMQCMLDY